jgi:U2 small nuclear ribonucleoprotein B''
VRNLDDRVKKQVQSRVLYTLFAEFGTVEKLVVGSGSKLRGQAWVTFVDVNAAAAALRKRQGFVGSGTKAMLIEFAKHLHPLGFQPPADAPRAVLASGKRARDENDLGEDGSTLAKVAKSSTPFHILVCSGITESAQNEATLEAAFQDQAGFVELRLVAGKGLAFTEFKSVVDAQAALALLDGMQVTADYALQLTFGTEA